VSGKPSDPSPSEWMREAEAELLELAVETQRAEWVYATHISDDTEALSSLAQSRYIAATLRRIEESSRLTTARLTAEEARKLRALRLSLTLAAPREPSAARELTALVATMQAEYAKGRHTPQGSTTPLDLQGLSRILFESREPSVLEDAWSGWHRVGRAVRPSFVRYVALANRGARELGFADTGAMWASKYEMDPGTFAREVDRLWEQVRPLYEALRTWVRRRLRERYGEAVVPLDGPIPCHLLGDMWAQSWEGILGLVTPPQAQGAGLTIAHVLKERGIGPVEMVRFGERFFDSLGFEKLPPTFWERSMFVRPRDREVICHASAWDVDLDADLRIKMCIEPTDEDFQTIHHELGHNYYQRAYRHQPYLFRESAHDGFHEAIGDVLGLSVTPRYLTEIGLADGGADGGDGFPFLFRKAFEKIPFLPFGLLIDKWRWGVFDGSIGPERYNAAWWDFKARYQGVAPPKPRGEEEFDPGAKYHVPANVPYIRYFLSYILQFQLHRGLLRAAGHHGPVHLGTIYGSEAAGAKLRAMLELGSSRPWPEALELVAGERRMDASALLEYFAPIHRWLDEENRRDRAS
jgi:peptidyl-dipeptidase A